MEKSRLTFVQMCAILLMEDEKLYSTTEAGKLLGKGYNHAGVGRNLFSFAKNSSFLGYLLKDNQDPPEDMIYSIKKKARNGGISTAGTGRLYKQIAGPEPLRLLVLGVACIYLSDPERLYKPEELIQGYLEERSEGFSYLKGLLLGVLTAKYHPKKRSMDLPDAFTGREWRAIVPKPVYLKLIEALDKPELKDWQIPQDMQEALRKQAEPQAEEELASDTSPSAADPVALPKTGGEDTETESGPKLNDEQLPQKAQESAHSQAKSQADSQELVDLAPEAGEPNLPQYSEGKDPKALDSDLLNECLILLAKQESILMQTLSQASAAPTGESAPFAQGSGVSSFHERKWTTGEDFHQLYGLNIPTELQEVLRRQAGILARVANTNGRSSNAEGAEPSQGTEHEASQPTEQARGKKIELGLKRFIEKILKTTEIVNHIAINMIHVNKFAFLFVLAISIIFTSYCYRSPILKKLHGFYCDILLHTNSLNDDDRNKKASLVKYECYVIEIKPSSP